MTATTKDGRAIELSRDDESRRYVGVVDGTIAAVVAYIAAGDVIMFTHTEADPAFEGQGVASTLVRWALDDVRVRGLRVVPLCPFVKAFIPRHPGEYGDLVFTSRTSVVHD